MKQMVKAILLSVLLLGMIGSVFALEQTLGLRVGASYPQVLERPNDKEYNPMLGLSYEVWLKKCLSIGIYPYMTKVSAGYSLGDYESPVVGADLLLKARPDIKALYLGADKPITRIAPYATVGVGVSNFFPKFEDHHITGNPDDDYSYTAMTLPSWGLGISFLTKYGIDFDLGFQKEELASDYLDGYEYTEPNDAYWMAFLGVSHTFGRKISLPKYVFVKEAPLVLQGITFEFDSANLTPEGKMILDDVVASLMYYPEVEVEIQGHTDSDGDADYNMELSRKRADAVKSYMVLKGVGEYRLSTSGWGETRPIAGNDTPEGKAQNRRIEFVKTK